MFESGSVDRKDDVFGDVDSLLWCCIGRVNSSVHRKAQTFTLKATDLTIVFLSVVTSPKNPGYFDNPLNVLVSIHYLFLRPSARCHDDLDIATTEDLKVKYQL